MDFPLSILDDATVSKELSLKLLRSGVLPSEEEEELLQNVIKKRCAELEIVRAEVHRLTQILQQLEHTQKHLTAYAEVHRKLCGHIRRFPDALLQKLFRFCKTPLPLSNMRASGQKPAVWNIAQVCQRWRTVVLSCPDVWSSININYSNSSLGEDGFGNCDLLGLYLENSGDHPLSIECLILFHARELNTQLMKLLSDVSIRWQNITFIDCNDKILRGLDSIQGRLPLLRKLTFRGLTISKNLDLFEHAPLLRSVSLEDIYCDGSSTFNLPWKQLEVLDLTSNIDFGLFKTALELAQSLTTLNLSSVVHRRSSTFSHPISAIEFSNVHSLSFNTKSLANIVNILRSSEFPCIKCLFVQFSQESTQLDITELIELYTRRLSKVKSLTISIMGDLPISQIVSLLKVASTAETLHFSFSESDDNEKLLDKLVYDNNDPELSLLPNLSALSFETLISYEIDAVLSIVNSRMPGNRGIESENLQRNLSMTPTSLASIEFQYAPGLFDDVGHTAWSLSKLEDYAKEGWLELEVHDVFAALFDD